MAASKILHLEIFWKINFYQSVRYHDNNLDCKELDINRKIVPVFNYHSLKEMWGLEVQLDTLLIPKPDGHKRSTSRLGHFTRLRWP